jgi:hypothetical protein
MATGWELVADNELFLSVILLRCQNLGCISSDIRINANIMFLVIIHRPAFV